MSAWSLVAPLALGAAVSPTLLMIQLFVLAGGVAPVRRAWAYTAGVIGFSILFVLVVATLAKGLQLVSPDQSWTSRLIKIAAAVALLLLAVRLLRHRDRPGAMQRLLVRAETAPTWGFLAIGFGAMALNASSLVLMLAATHIAVTTGSPDQVPLMCGFVVLCAALPALLPALVVTVAGQRATPALTALNRFTTTHSAAINAGIYVFFAALLLLSAARS